MLKQNITYTNFDNEQVTKTLHFNISKTELLDNIELKDEVDVLQRELFDGPERQLDALEVRRLIAFVRKIIKISYGVRNGDRFVKDSQVFEEFVQTAAYDEFLFSLFREPEKMFEFILAVLPQELRAEAEKLATDQVSPQTVVSNGTHNHLENIELDSISDETETVVKDNRPLYQKENRLPTDEEIKFMSRHELAEAMRYKLSRND